MNEQSHKLNSPKNFFLWLGIMASLYVGTFSLVVLLFQIINTALPEQLRYFIDPSYGAFRMAISTLIVAFPLYVYLTRVANQKIRKNPEEAKHPFRKWLIYLTLFVTGATLAIDLILVLNTYLGGDLTSRFILKAVAVIIVAGFIFYYYLNDLKGSWREEEKKSKMLAYIAGLFILASIIAGFFIIGSPAEQRLRRIDGQKVSDLQNISWQIESYYQENENLPETLRALENDGFVVPSDPQKEESYTYNILDELTYELCAEFNQKSPRFESPDRFPTNNWEYNAGPHCFEIDIQKDQVLKPIPVR